MQVKNKWILLRGLARGVGHWGSFSDKIQQQFPEDEFEFLDLPGNGARNKENSPLRIADYVQDLRSQSQFVRSGEPFKILSVSLGAMITVEWMRKHPQEIRHAYLICTSSSGISPFYHRFRLPNYLKAPQLLRHQQNEEALEKLILSLVTNNQERRDQEFSRLKEYSRNHPMRLENMIRQLLAASRYEFPAKAPGNLTLIGSYGDKLVSPECTLSIARKWGVEPFMHPWAGHDIPVDDPVWVIEHLL